MKVCSYCDNWRWNPRMISQQYVDGLEQRIAELEAEIKALTKQRDNPDLNPTNVADLVWILERAGYFFESQGDTTWARRALRYKEIFSEKEQNEL